MKSGESLQQELGDLFGGLTSAVQAAEERRRGLEARFQQEVEQLLGEFASHLEAAKRRRRGIERELQRDLDRFYGELIPILRTDEERQRGVMTELRRDLKDMFRLLEPTIAAATVALQLLETRSREEQDRRTARKFSALNLVRTQELDLSRIFGELLDPSGDHSQGDLFLSLLLEELISTPGEAAEQLLFFRPPGGSNTRVHIEYPTGDVVMSGGKRRAGSVDLVLQFDGNRWIGIENKPWAGDQEEQVNRYLSFLDKHASETRQGGGEPRVLLLYWSGTGSAPDHTGLADEQMQRCLTVPYRKRFGSASVEGWLKRCCVECQADRVLRFLRDLLDYIQSHFSESPPHPITVVQAH